MTKTVRDRLIQGIIATGGVLVKSTSKSEVYQHPKVPGEFVYIGRAGSFRVGRTKGVSIPYDRWKAVLLESN